MPGSSVTPVRVGPSVQPKVGPAEPSSHASGTAQGTEAKTPGLATGNSAATHVRDELTAATPDFSSLSRQPTQEQRDLASMGAQSQAVIPASLMAPRPGCDAANGEQLGVTPKVPVQVNLNKSASVQLLTAAAEEMAAHPHRNPARFLALLNRNQSELLSLGEPISEETRRPGTLNERTFTHFKDSLVVESSKHGSGQEWEFKAFPRDSRMPDVRVIGDGARIDEIFVMASTGDRVSASLEPDGSTRVFARGAFSPLQDGSTAVFRDGSWAKVNW